MSIQNSNSRVPCVIYRVDAPELGQELARALGADVEVRPVDSDCAARHLMTELGDRVAAVIVDQADLATSVNSPVFQDALTIAPHALRVLLHDDLSLEAIQSLLKSRLISRCFNKPVDAELLGSEIFAASLRLEQPTQAHRESEWHEGLPGVLIVDDEVMAKKYLKMQLEQGPNEFVIYTADSAEAAMTFLEEQASAIAVVISDQRMPGIKGDQFLNTLRRAQPDVVRILTSAYQEVDVALDAVNHGEIFRYLGKPWELEEVRQCILDALDEFARKRQTSSQKTENLAQQFQALQAQREKTLSALVLRDLAPFADAELIAEFMALLHQIETLPVSRASISASQTTALEQELADGLSDALRLARSRLQDAERPTNAAAVSAALIGYLKHPTDAGREDLHVYAKQLLLALETVLQASGLNMSCLELSDADGQCTLSLGSPGERAQLSVYTHLLAPLTRITHQFLAQQSALLLLFVLTRLLGIRLHYQVHKQSLILSLALPGRS